MANPERMRLIASVAFLYIGSFVAFQTFRQWRRLGHSPIASMTRAKTTRIRKLVEDGVGLGLFFWAVFFVGYLGDPAWWRQIPHVSSGGEPLEQLATLLLVISAAQLTAGNVTMGLSWRMGIVDQPQPLVRHGIYRRIRHPINGAMILYFAGAALLMPNVLTIPAMALAIFSILAETALEEDYWLEKEPEEYSRMMAETRKFWIV